MGSVIINYKIGNKNVWMEIEIPSDLFCLVSWSCDLLSEFQVFGTDFTLWFPNDKE